MHIKSLRKELFLSRDYDPMNRPVLNYSHPVNVSLGLGVEALIELDTGRRLLSSNGWLHLLWRDEQLTWRPDEFGGIAEIRVHIEDIYRPDVTLTNSVDPVNLIKSSTHSDATLSSDGNVSWYPALTMKTTCETGLDLSEWPFDEHVCEYHFGSWTYYSDGMVLTGISESIYISTESDYGQWTVKKGVCESKKHPYFGEDGSLLTDKFYPEVVCSLTLQRRPTVYAYAVSLPTLGALLLNLMALGFLDVRNALRFALSACALFMLLAILLFLVATLGIGTSSTGLPKLVVYLGRMLVLVCLTLLWSAFALNFAAQSAYSLPTSIMERLTPMHKFLVRGGAGNDGDTQRLTLESPDDDVEGGGGGGGGEMKRSSATAPAGSSNSPQPPNLIAIQVVDKILFALCLLLIVVLHN